jgi:hypothetical protein
MQQPYPPQGPNPYQQQAVPGGYQPVTHGFAQTEAPGASTAQICGIIGIILFFNLIGIILNIIAIVNGNKAIAQYNAYPGRYTEASFRKAKTGRTCGIVGLCLFPVVLIIAIALLITISQGL